jgi:TrmH family RNA methyltransferase
MVGSREREIMIITSPANEKLKYARRVREGREPGWMFLEGDRLIEAYLDAGGVGGVAFYPPEPSERARALLEILRTRGCSLWPTQEAVLATVSDTVSPQGVIVLAERPSIQFDQLRRQSPPPLLVGLDALQDPGNTGTILRTAEASGADGVLMLQGSVDPFAPKTLRSAMGSAFRLPILSDLAPERMLALAVDYGCQVVATDGRAPMPYTSYDWQQPTLLLLGNEGNGIRPALLDASHVRLSIPMKPPVESLNVAIAAAILLFEARRMRANVVPVI